MNDLIFLPVFVQVFLVQLLYIYLAVAKARAAGEVDESRRALHADAWPDKVQQINNNIRNQFEVPVLFYVLCVLIYLLNAVTSTVLVLAWLFVLSRIAHSFVHITSNYVPLRRQIFLVGCLMVIALSVVCGIALIGSIDA